MKLPLLFGLTLAVTFPSLYVFNALVGSRLLIFQMLRLLIAAMSVMLTVLASFGPIVAFFAVSTQSYSFMLLLNIAVFGVAGILGLAFLLRTIEMTAGLSGILLLIAAFGSLVNARVEKVRARKSAPCS